MPDCICRRCRYRRTHTDLGPEGFARCRGIVSADLELAGIRTTYIPCRAPRPADPALLQPSLPWQPARKGCPHTGSRPHSRLPQLGTHGCEHPVVSNAWQSAAQPRLPVPKPRLAHDSPSRSLPSQASVPSRVPLLQRAARIHCELSSSPQFSAHASVPLSNRASCR